jgi:hypothetical protein
MVDRRGIETHRSIDQGMLIDRADRWLSLTVVDNLNTELEVAIRYPQPRRLTAPAVAERQRPSWPEPSDLDLGNVDTDSGREFRNLRL